MLDSYPTRRIDKALGTLGNPSAAEEVEIIKGVLHSVRNIRGENRISPAKELVLRLQVEDDKSQKILSAYRKTIQSMGRISELEISDSVVTAKSALASLVVSGHSIKVVVPLEGLVDIAEEIKRIQKNIEKLDKSLEGLVQRLSNDNFVKNAAPEVVENDRMQMESLKKQRIAMTEALMRLKGEG
jgi:valyl-tRNA synthetase